jgi:hypothetical protein
VTDAEKDLLLAVEEMASAAAALDRAASHASKAYQAALTATHEPVSLEVAMLLAERLGGADFCTKAAGKAQATMFLVTSLDVARHGRQKLDQFGEAFAAGAQRVAAESCQCAACRRARAAVQESIDRSRAAAQEQAGGAG